MSPTAPPTTTLPCPLCGGSAYTTVLQGARDWIWRKPGVFQVQRCDGCALVATRPRPTDEALGFYYDDTYSGEAEAGMRRFQTESWLGRRLNRSRLNIISKIKKLGASDRLLDVGCSYGGFLREARRSGCTTSGLDLDAGSIEQAVDKAHTDYRVGTLEGAGYPPESFTIITFMESLEHHTDPVAALRAAYAALAPGGLCVVEVPNFAGFWRKVFRTAWLPLLIPQHLFHFTPATLKAAMKAAGMTPVHHQTIFAPLEGVASLGLWLTRILRSPPMGAKPSWRTPLDLAVFLVLLVLYVVTEIPSQALLTVLGKSGHQMAIAKKAE